MLPGSDGTGTRCSIGAGWVWHAARISAAGRRNLRARMARICRKRRAAVTRAIASWANLQEGRSGRDVDIVQQPVRIVGAGVALEGPDFLGCTGCFAVA